MELLVEERDTGLFAAMMQDDWREMLAREGLATADAGDDASPRCPACGAEGARVDGACPDCGLHLG